MSKKEKELTKSEISDKISDIENFGDLSENNSGLLGRINDLFQQSQSKDINSEDFRKEFDSLFKASTGNSDFVKLLISIFNIFFKKDGIRVDSNGDKEIKPIENKTQNVFSEIFQTLAEFVSMDDITDEEAKYAEQLMIAAKSSFFETKTNEIGEKVQIMKQKGDLELEILSKATQVFKFLYSGNKDKRQKLEATEARTFEDIYSYKSPEIAINSFYGLINHHKSILSEKREAVEVATGGLSMYQYASNFLRSQMPKFSPKSLEGCGYEYTQVIKEGKDLEAPSILGY